MRGTRCPTRARAIWSSYCVLLPLAVNESAHRRGRRGVDHASTGRAATGRTHGFCRASLSAHVVEAEQCRLDLCWVGDSCRAREVLVFHRATGLAPVDLAGRQRRSCGACRLRCDGSYVFPRIARLTWFPLGGSGERLCRRSPDPVLPGVVPRWLGCSGDERIVVCSGRRRHQRSGQLRTTKSVTGGQTLRGDAHLHPHRRSLRAGWVAA